MCKQNSSYTCKFIDYSEPMCVTNDADKFCQTIGITELECKLRETYYCSDIKIKNQICSDQENYICREFNIYECITTDYLKCALITKNQCRNYVSFFCS